MNSVSGFDAIDVQKVDTNKYRIVLTGDGLTIDAMLIGAGAEAIANALDKAGDPTALLRDYRAKRGGR